MMWLAALALAVVPLADRQQEARAQALEQEIRCVVCDHEPISQSGAEAAQDMRRVLRERIAAGDSDAAVRGYFADRFGEYVLLRPRLRANTFLLWATPGLLVLLAGLAYWQISRAPRALGPEPNDPFDER